MNTENTGNDMSKISDTIFEMANEHPTATLIAIISLSAFIGYKAIELPIKNACLKANMKTVDYIMSQIKFGV